MLMILTYFQDCESLESKKVPTGLRYLCFHFTARTSHFLFYSSYLVNPNISHPILGSTDLSNYQNSFLLVSLPGPPLAFSSDGDLRVVRSSLRLDSTLSSESASDYLLSPSAPPTCAFSLK